MLQDPKPFYTLFLRLSQVFWYRKWKRPCVSDSDGNYRLPIPTILVPLSFPTHEQRLLTIFLDSGHKFRNSWINLRRNPLQVYGHIRGLLFTWTLYGLDTSEDRDVARDRTCTTRVVVRSIHYTNRTCGEKNGFFFWVPACPSFTPFFDTPSPGQPFCLSSKKKPKSQKTREGIRFFLYIFDLHIIFIFDLHIYFYILLVYQ